MLTESNSKQSSEFRAVQALRRTFQIPASSRLREARENRGLDQEALAASTNVALSELQSIEAGTTEATLGTLWKLAVGLGVPFAELLGAGDNRVTVQRVADAQVLRTGDGVLESRPLMTSGVCRWVETYALTLAAGGRYESDAHPRGTREIIVVVSGVLQVEIDGCADTLGPGDSISFLADLPHVYTNPGSSPGQYHDIIVYDR